MTRRIFIGTKVWEDRNVIKDVCYVLFEETGDLWVMSLESTGCCNLVVNRTIEELEQYFDRWQDLGTISDGVRVNDILKITYSIERAA